MRSLSTRITDWFNRKKFSLVLSKFGYGNRVSKQTWEHQYTSGVWDGLNSEKESLHYLEILEFIDTYKTVADPAILDIGAGEGVLFGYLKDKYAIYTGIDIAESAILKARQNYKDVTDARFETADYQLESFPGKFDIIIFNETLYYFSNPLATIRKSLTENLNPGGLFIVSMCSFTGNDKIWEKLAQRLIQLSASQVVSGEQQWEVRVFRA